MLELAVPGRHNLQNALAAVAVGERLGLDFAQVAGALRDFHGAERRFERHGEAGGVLVVDDYGHHPTEIAAVLAAARATLDRRLVVAFQPHRYSRTAQLLDEFGPALKDADEIVLTDIYAASEEPIPGVTVEVLADAVRRGSGVRCTSCKALDDVVPELLKIVRPGDAVITLGAGSIGTLPSALMQALRAERRGALMPVAAPADKRFRRAHVSPKRRRSWLPSWRTLGRLRRGWSRWSPSACIAAADLALSAEALTMTRITVSGNSRMSRGEVLALLDGLRGASMVTVDLEHWRQKLLLVAVGGRCGDAPRVSGHRRRGDVASGSRWASAESATRCT